MVELSGSLGSVDLLPIIRLLSELRQTGSLQLSRGDWSARLDLRDGRVVAASFAEERGLGALTALGLVMRDAEFTYMEGPSPFAADLDLTPDRVRGHLETPAGIGVLALDAVPRPSVSSVQSTSDGDQVVLQRETISRLLAIDGRRTLGEIVGRKPSLPLLLDLAHLTELGLIRLDAAPLGALDPPPRTEHMLPSSVPALADIASRSTLVPVPTTPTPVPVCPKLGFADDPASHFSRPTAVHRCYASGPQEAVSTLEQREFCLSDRYGTCPRLRAAIVDAVASTPEIKPDHHLRTPAPVAAQKAPAETAVPVGTYRLLPGVSIALTIAALVAVFVAFVRPGLDTPPTASAPVPVATLALVPIATLAPPAQVADPTLPARVPAAAKPSSVTQVGNPTPPAQATPTAAAPVTTTPSQASVTGPVAQGPINRSVVGSVLLDTVFREPQPGWIDNVPFAGWYAGAYTLAARVAPRFVAVAAPQSEALGDVVVSATFRKVGGPSGGGYGFVLRDQEPALRDGANQTGHFYVVEVGDLGQIGMWRRDGDRWLDILSWTDSTAVRQGNATNELAVRAIGNQFTLFVNGREQTTQTDSALALGGVGIFVGGDNNEVAIDRFTLASPL